MMGSGWAHTPDGNDEWLRHVLGGMGYDGPMGMMSGMGSYSGME